QQIQRDRDHDPFAGEWQAREMNQIETSEWLQDDGGRGEGIVRDDDVPHDRGDDTRVPRETGEKHVEGRAEASAEQQRRRQDVQPLYDEVFHRRPSSVYST